MVANINNGINGVALRQQNKVQQRTQEQGVNKTENINRAEEIKKQIEAGTYKIDIQKTAEAVADTLL
ncbi:MAG: Anti-sigma-28 factor, FlgM [Campylobacterota bacterium]|nr:Anti-sigma-28 factor, FlgM [Campylobacterota bacterium]